MVWFVCVTCWFGCCHDCSCIVAFATYLLFACLVFAFEFLVVCCVVMLDLVAYGFNFVAGLFARCVWVLFICLLIVLFKMLACRWWFADSLLSLLVMRWLMLTCVWVLFVVVCCFVWFGCFIICGLFTVCLLFVWFAFW